MHRKFVSLVCAWSMLLSALVFPASGAETIAVKPSTWKIFVNGVEQSLAGYNIGGSNYYKLRDIAMAVSGTDKQFEVTWNPSDNGIYLTTGKAYTALGGELSGTDSSEKAAKLTSSKVFVDGALTEYTAYYIEGNNYFRLRDILKTFDVGLTWSADGNTVQIDTTTPYIEEGETAPEETEVGKQIVLVRRLDEDHNTISEAAGFLISQDGKIATCFQAIRGAEYVTVRLPGGEELEIQGVLAYNVEKDIAILKADIQTDTPLSLAKSQDEILAKNLTAYEQLGQARNRAVEATSRGAVESTRGSGGQDVLLNVKVRANSLGSPVMGEQGSVAGMLCSVVYKAKTYPAMIPASEILAMNMDGAPKSMEALNKELYPLADNSAPAIIGGLLSKKYPELVLERNKKIQIFDIVVTQENPQDHKLKIQIFVPENEEMGFSGHYFREANETEEGRAEIFAYCQQLFKMLYTYCPDYEYEGEIQCVDVVENKPEDDSEEVTYELYKSGYEWGEAYFAQSSEYNGWFFDTEKI